MVKIVVPLDNTDSTVTRFVAKGVTEQLIYSTEMPPIQEILYIQRGGINAFAQSNHPGEALKLDVEEHVVLAYKETPQDGVFDINKYQVEHVPIFHAPELGISITPMHVRVQLELTFTYKSKSYNNLINWLNAFRRRLQMAEAINYHDILYNYSIPTDILAYLNQVYQLTEAVRPYGRTLLEFITYYFADHGLMVRRNLNDSHRTLALNVKNTGCLGLFTQIPDLIETTKEPPSSEVDFTYVLEYDRVTALLLEYQMYIHNQVIDLIHLREYGDKRLHTTLHGGHKTFSQSVNTVTENPYGLLDYPDNGSHLDDGWRPNTVPEFFVTSLIVPVQLDLTQSTDLLDLNQLVGLGYPNWLLPILVKYRSKLTTHHAFPVCFDVFEVNATESRIPVTVTDNFHLVATLPLEPRNRYYVRVLLMTNLLSIDFALFDFDPFDLMRLLQWLYNHLLALRGLGQLPDPNGLYNNGIDPTTLVGEHLLPFKMIANNTRLTKQSLWDALNLINQSQYSHYDSRTVMVHTLITRTLKGKAHALV